MEGAAAMSRVFWYLHVAIFLPATFFILCKGLGVRASFDRWGPVVSLFLDLRKTLFYFVRGNTGEKNKAPNIHITHTRPLALARQRGCRLVMIRLGVLISRTSIRE